MGDLDHGMLNVPLDKRGGGSLDAQAARFLKAERHAKRKADVARFWEMRALRERSKALLSEHEAALIERYQAKFGRKAVRETIRGMAGSKLDQFIKFVERFLAEEQGS